MKPIEMPFESGHTGYLKVLYVEDDPDIREIALLALHDVGGLNVKVYESGALALKEVDDFAPQVILLDVMMPDMDGPETLAAMRRQGSVTSATAVAFMTAKVNANELADYHKLGVIDVIPKHFDPMTLADDVRAIWNRHNDRPTSTYPTDSASQP